MQRLGFDGCDLHADEIRTKVFVQKSIISPMFKHLCVAVIIWISQASAYSQANRQIDDSTSFILKDTRFGRISAEKIGSYPNPNSPSGTFGIIDNLSFTEITDTIPAKLNVNFGAEFIMESKANIYVPLTVVWKFPSVMTNNNGKNFHQISFPAGYYTNQLWYQSYGLDYNYEVKPGIWQLEIYHKNKLLYSRQFYLLLEI